MRSDRGCSCHPKAGHDLGRRVSLPKRFCLLDVLSEPGGRGVKPSFSRWVRAVQPGAHPSQPPLPERTRSDQAPDFTSSAGVTGGAQVGALIPGVGRLGCDCLGFPLCPDLCLFPPQHKRGRFPEHGWGAGWPNMTSGH